MLNKKSLSVLVAGCAIVGMTLPSMAQSFIEASATFESGDYYAVANEPITVDLEEARMAAINGSHDTSTEYGEFLATTNQAIAIDVEEAQMDAINGTKDISVDSGDVFATTSGPRNVAYQVYY